jgi:hypothetical protein
MADKAKFAFGSLANLDAAISAGKVDAFDLLCLVDDGVARIGWLDKDSKPVVIDVPEDEVIAVDSLPETGKAGVIYLVGKAVYIWHDNEFVAISESTDLSVFESRVVALETEIATKANAEEVDAKIAQIESGIADVATATKTYTDEKFDAAMDMCLHERYEIAYKPERTLVDYRGKEIRVMCPADTVWTKQTVGGTGNPNMHYMGFKAYAPDGAVSFKEDDKDFIEDQTMYYFENNDFAGIDEHGRKYSICWLALASYDEVSDTWTYFGAKSTVEKYIGWYYSVEWYDANGVIIGSDRIRINLSNEDCHLAIEPFYMANVTAEVKKYVDEQIEEIAEIPVVEF